MKEKSAKAFRTIREVADWLGVAAHVLRFWESKFSQIKPVKRGGGRRYYRPDDMALIGGIKVLLHDRGMTIRGVQRMIREEGVAAVAALAPPIDQIAVPEELVDGIVPAKADDDAAAFRADAAREEAEAPPRRTAEIAPFPGPRVAPVEPEAEREAEAERDSQREPEVTAEPETSAEAAPESAAPPEAASAPQPEAPPAPEAPASETEDAAAPEAEAETAAPEPGTEQAEFALSPAEPVEPAVEAPPADALPETPDPPAPVAEAAPDPAPPPAPAPAAPLPADVLAFDLLDGLRQTAAQQGSVPLDVLDKLRKLQTRMSTPASGP